MDITKEFSDRKSFLNWSLIAMIAKTEMTDESMENPMDVTVTLNGCELNVIQFFDRIEEEYHRGIEAKAKELLEEAKSDILDPFREAVEDVTKNLERSLWAKLNKKDINS